jgi:hypothetical protein
MTILQLTEQIKTVIRLYETNGRKVERIWQIIEAAERESNKVGGGYDG